MCRHLISPTRCSAPCSTPWLTRSAALRSRLVLLLLLFYVFISMFSSSSSSSSSMYIHIYCIYIIIHKYIYIYIHTHIRVTYLRRHRGIYTSSSDQPTRFLFPPRSIDMFDKMCSFNKLEYVNVKRIVLSPEE